MNYRDPYSKKFFAEQWRKPFKRVRKIGLPILVSSVGVFLVMICFLGGIPWGAENKINSLFVVFQVLCAVITGAFVVFLGRFHHMKTLSRFETIKIRVRSKKYSQSD